MGTNITPAILATALASMAFGQTTFNIADVHVSAPTLHPSKRVALRAGRYELEMATMVDLIATAYGVDPDKVLGGPSWLNMDSFDVIAKAPIDTSPQTLKLMLQSLLADRFKLVVHTDQRPMAAFVLSAGAGKPKLQESNGSGQPGCQRQPTDSGPIPATCHGITMAAFAALLGPAAGDYLSGPVVNETKLEGTYDFTLKWSSRSRLAADGVDGITIFDAIDKQLGLKLESKQIPTPVLVVDSVTQKPTANPPGVSEALPPAPQPQFEAATIKPTDPAFGGPRLQVAPNVNVAGVTLSFLMQQIWFITPDMIVGAPKWLDTDRWDIVGKVATTPGNSSQTDLDSMIRMVHDLIQDRFKLKTHMEERVVPAYTLTAVKPKLQKADPANRTGCKEGPGTDGKDPRLTNPMLTRLVTCRNMTMAQFTEQLPAIANARLAMGNLYLRAPVLNSTNLDGAWDFTLSYSDNVPTSQSTDPDGALSLSDAITRQLGLKLDLEKRLAPVLVIDHIEPSPVDN